jgi:hypothetical protein
VHAPSHPIACLDEADTRAERFEVAGRDEACEPGTRHDHVRPVQIAMYRHGDF